MTNVPDALGVYCPHCGAPAGAPCISAGGLAREVHRARVRIIREAHARAVTRALYRPRLEVHAGPRADLEGGDLRLKPAGHEFKPSELEELGRVSPYLVGFLQACGVEAGDTLEIVVHKAGK